MTLEERHKAYLEAINELGRQFGLQIGAQINTRQLGPVVQCEPTIVLQPIEGWQEPEPTPTWQENAVTGNIPISPLSEHADPASRASVGSAGSNGNPILTPDEAREALRRR